MTVIKIQDLQEAKRRKAGDEVQVHPDPGQDPENVHPERVAIVVEQSVVDQVQMKVVVDLNGVVGQNPDPDHDHQSDKKSKGVIKFNKHSVCKQFQIFCILIFCKMRSC